MKHPTKKALAVLLTVLLLTGAAVYAADAGTAEDPLVTLSYMTNTFQTQIASLFQDALDDTQATLNDTLDRQAASLEQAIQAAAQSSGETLQAADTAWQTVTLTAGQSLAVEAGAQVLFLSGSGTFSGGYAVDVTAGTSGATMSLSADHLYTVSSAGTVSGEGQLLLQP